jgi:hypothetical protein
MGINRNIGQAVENGDIIYVVIFDNFNVFNVIVPTINIVGYKYFVIFNDLILFKSGCRLAIQRDENCC